jgi:hypothetical protein
MPKKTICSKFVKKNPMSPPLQAIVETCRRRPKWHLDRDGRLSTALASSRDMRRGTYRLKRGMWSFFLTNLIICGFFWHLIRVTCTFMQKILKIYDDVDVTGRKNLKCTSRRQVGQNVGTRYYQAAKTTSMPVLTAHLTFTLNIFPC